MAEPFNDERIEHLTTSHNWELAYFDDGRRVTHNALIPWLLPHTEGVMGDNKKEARPDLFESHQGQKSAVMPCYVAMLDHTNQVGFDQSQTFREAKPLNGTETVDELMAWGKKWMEQPQIVIVIAT